MELYMIKKSLQIFLHFLPLLPFGAIYKKTLAASVHPQNSSAKISPTRDSNVVKPPREGGTSTLPAGELTSVQINARTIAKVPSSVGAAGNRHKNIRNPLQSIDTTLKATRKGRCHCSEKKKPHQNTPPTAVWIGLFQQRDKGLLILKSGPPVWCKKSSQWPSQSFMLWCNNICCRMKCVAVFCKKAGFLKYRSTRRPSIFFGQQFLNQSVSFWGEALDICDFVLLPTG